MKRTFVTLLLGAQVCANAQSVNTAVPSAPPRAASAPSISFSEGHRRVGAVTEQVAGLTAYRDSVPPVQVRFSAVDSKAAQEMDEDLAVMGLLIDKAIDEPHYAMGIDMVFTKGSRSVRGMYIEGSGPMYMIKVGFPLLGPATTEQKPEEKPANSEWEKALHAVRGQKPSVEWESSSRSSVQFDPKEVEALKKVLLNTMKNGANFRHLKPEEHLSFAVFGRPSPVRAYVRKSSTSEDAPSAKRGGGSGGGYAISWSSSGGNDQGTVMTLRAKKADIDAFAKGEIDYDAFAAKVTTTTYAGSGYGVTSVNSWLQGSGGGSVGLQVR